MSHQRPNDGKKKDDKKEKGKSEASTSKVTEKKKDYKSKDQYYTPISSAETLGPTQVSSPQSTASVYFSVQSESETEMRKARKARKSESKEKSPAKKRDKDTETERAKRKSVTIPSPRAKLDRQRVPSVKSAPIFASAESAGVTTQDDGEAERAKRKSVTIPSSRAKLDRQRIPSVKAAPIFASAESAGVTTQDDGEAERAKRKSVTIPSPRAKLDRQRVPSVKSGPNFASAESAGVTTQDDGETEGAKRMKVTILPNTEPRLEPSNILEDITSVESAPILASAKSVRVTTQGDAETEGAKRMTMPSNAEPRLSRPLIVLPSNFLEDILSVESAPILASDESAGVTTQDGAETEGPKRMQVPNAESRLSRLQVPNAESRLSRLQVPNAESRLSRIVVPSNYLDETLPLRQRIASVESAPILASDDSAGVTTQDGAETEGPKRMQVPNAESRLSHLQGPNAESRLSRIVVPSNYLDETLPLRQRIASVESAPILASDESAGVTTQDGAETEGPKRMQVPNAESRLSRLQVPYAESRLSRIVVPSNFFDETLPLRVEFDRQRIASVESAPILPSAESAGVTTQDDAETEGAKRMKVTILPNAEPRLEPSNILEDIPSVVSAPIIAPAGLTEGSAPGPESQPEHPDWDKVASPARSATEITETESLAQDQLHLGADRIRNPNRRARQSTESIVSILRPWRSTLQNRTDNGMHSSDSEYALQSRADALLQTNLQMGHAFVYMVIPPDGGFGWFIMVISFLCQTIVDGIIFSVGVLLPEMARELDVAQSSIVLVAAIQVGSISSALINRYGFRPVALAGTICSCAAIYIATYATNLPMLIFFYSVIGGPALSMIWVSSQLIIGYYFERYRPIANGLSCSGAGAGIMIFCALNSALVPSIGWRQMSRIHVAILLSVLIMALTFREVAPTKVGTITEPDPETETDQDDVEDTFRSVRYSLTFSVRSAGADTLFEHMFEEIEQPKRKKPNICIRCVGKCCPALRRRRIDEDAEFTTKKYVIRPDLMEKQDIFYTGPADYDRHNDEIISEMPDGRNIELLAGRAKSVNYTLSVMQTTVPEDAGTGSTVSMRVRRSTAVRRRPAAMTWRQRLSPSNWVPEKMIFAFQKLFDFNLLTIMEFRVLLASAFFFPMGMNIPFLYSKARSEVGTFHGSMIAPLIGFSNLVFRISSGFLGQRYKQYTTYICGGGIFFGGFIAFVSGIYGKDVIWFQYLYAFCFGMAPAFYSTLRAIIYVRALGLDKLTNAFGLTSMAMGMGVFVGTTCAGYLNEYTGGYSVSFLFAGVNLMIAGGLKLILPSLIKWKDKRLSKSIAKL